MLRTLIDPSVVSRHLLSSEWNVTKVLHAVAALEPPAHALIDSGALCTGMSNLAVATALLALLPHVEGVVFLTPQGEKKILLRHDGDGGAPEAAGGDDDDIHDGGADVEAVAPKEDTAGGAGGVIMDLERCDLPKERRFSFFDQVCNPCAISPPLPAQTPPHTLSHSPLQSSFPEQVHTTGMDIPQGASARAVLTLGKDLIFRDYAQGAYRMRGIGKGQTIVLFVIPEVARLLASETALGHGVKLDQRHAQLSSMSPQLRAKGELEDVAAWLLINSVRSEKLQFPLWCMQCAQNVWRKRAFAQLALRHDEFASASLAGRAGLAGGDAMGASPTSLIAAEMPVRECLDVFREHVERDVSNTVPEQADTRAQIAAGAANHGGLLQDVEDIRSIERIQAMLIGVEAQVPGWSLGGAGGPEPEPVAEQEQAFEQEKEQEHEHEHEHEQEKQREQERQVEQEEPDEPDEFKRDKYVRDDEPARVWSLSSLTLPPDFASSGGAAGTSTGTTGTAQGFFPASRFVSHRSHLDKRGPLHWPDYVLLSSDHTSPRWRYDSHRRLKNILVTMEWVPDVDAVSPLTAHLVDGLPAAGGAELSETQEARLRRVFELNDPRGRGALNESALLTVLADMGLRPDQHADDRAAVDELFTSLRAAGGGGHDADVELGEDAFLTLMQSQRFVPGEAGRYWVALSLREAESLRGAMHVAMDLGIPLVSGGRVAVGLRAHGVLLDAVGAEGPRINLAAGGMLAFPPSPRQQMHSAMQAYRFVDCQLGFEEADARLLLRMLRADTCEQRKKWFVDTCACRRRPQGKLERMASAGGIATVLEVEDEFHLLVQAATMRTVSAELTRRTLGSHDVFHCFNLARNMMLSVGELGAGLAWLGMELDEAQLHDVVRGLDEAGDGMVSLDEWVNALAPEIAENEPSTQDLLAAIHLQPLDVTEIRVGAPPGPARLAEPVPPAALAKFKFKLVPQHKLSCVWSTRNTSARSDLSLWSPDLDNANLQKRSKAKVCLGHACTTSVDAPSKGHLPIVLEVIDSSVMMGSSDHLHNLVGQLLPPPVRYRLAWHSLQHKPPLYLWRAVPPSGQYLALGMIATTSDEPPALESLRCVPRRWCEKQARPAKLLWRDEGEGGRPGSFWAIPTMELIVAGGGAEPPEEALASWTLKESKMTTEAAGWLLSQ